jgi:SSS family solute:Na+ symporter
MAPAVMGVALWFTLQGGQTIVALLLMAYSLVTQLFPVLRASLLRVNPVTKVAAFASILVGEATVAVLSLNKLSVATLFPFLPDALKDLNVGMVALTLNVLTLIVVSALTRAPRHAGPRLQQQQG